MVCACGHTIELGDSDERSFAVLLARKDLSERVTELVERGSASDLTFDVDIPAFLACSNCFRLHLMTGVLKERVSSATFAVETDPTGEIKAAMRRFFHE